MAEDMRHHARNANHQATRLSMMAIADDYDRIVTTLETIVASKNMLGKAPLASCLLSLGAALQRDDA
jgi:hypothetical protein